ncbi:MAG TPA: transposase [Candidatus Sulfomarinibacteraceae bacterium]|nr:transposase [Candidatus Sulfomarinibacteraceae bacterium]
MANNQHMGWYSRGYLPHFNAPGLVQGITFRLADALPTHVKKWLANETTDESTPEYRAKVESYLNAGYGSCYLKNPQIASVVENTLHHFDGQRYQLIAWVVMPNHVHVIVEMFEGHPMQRVIHSWKSYTASIANRILNRRGRFWFRDYFDRYIRDEHHLSSAIRYVHYNPVTAGLVESPELWRYSSARFYE